MDTKNIKKLQKLKEQIERSTQDKNGLVLAQDLAQDIIAAFRNGVAPNIGLLSISVGRKNLFKDINVQLNEVERGKSKLKFINGAYGSGKTHTLMVLREFAFKNNFASSYITLSPRECPLFDLGIVYRHIVKGLRTAKCREKPALETIIQDWINRLLTLGQSNFDYAINKIKTLDPDFKSVLICLIESFNKGSWNTADAAIRWIQGDINTKRECKPLGASSYVCDETSLMMLQNIIFMLRLIGFKGLIILLDEAENIPSISNLGKKKKAYENLWRLINCNLETSHSFFVYATTPRFFNEMKGEERYNIVEKKITKLQPLSVESLKSLALKIRDLYIKAHGWSNYRRVSDEKVIKYCEKLVRHHGFPILARDFVRSMVASLDVCQQNSSVNLLQTIN